MTLEDLKNQYRKRSITWEQYEAEKFKLDGDLEIFRHAQKMAINAYNAAMKDYTSGKADIKAYIRARKKGITAYMRKLYDVGLASELMPDDRVDYFCWKGLKLELADLAGHLPIRWDTLSKANEELLSQAAGKTIVVALEAFDEFNRLYVPLLKDNWRQRFMENAQCKPVVDGYNAAEYSKEKVTKQEKAEYERWRDGL